MRVEGGQDWEVSGGGGQQIDWRQPEPLGPLGPALPWKPGQRRKLGQFTFLPPFVQALITCMRSMSSYLSHKFLGLLTRENLRSFLRAFTWKCSASWCKYPWSQTQPPSRKAVSVCFQMTNYPKFDFWRSTSSPRHFHSVHSRLIGPKNCNLVGRDSQNL